MYSWQCMGQASLNRGVLQSAVTSLSVLTSHSTHRQTISIKQIINLDAQTKSKIIADITATVVKTIKQTEWGSLKGPYLKILLTKRLMKQSNQSKVPQFQNLKTKEIKYKANNSITAKINEAINAMKKR